MIASRSKTKEVLAKPAAKSVRDAGRDLFKSYVDSLGGVYADVWEHEFKASGGSNDEPIWIK